MLQLAFSSTMKDGFDEDALSRLVSHCRRNNIRAGVTGSLVVGGNRFAEIIEGEESEISSMFGAICRDQRHHAIVLLGRRLTDERVFPDSPLGLQIIAPLGPAMSLSQMARLLRDDVRQRPLFAPLNRYASILAAA